MENSNSNRKVVLEVRQLNKSFGDNIVLKDFNLQLYEGENLVVIGRSGAGKSVLIKCIVGLETPDSGDVFLFGKNTKELNQREMNEFRSRIGFLFQGSALYDSMTIRENLEFSFKRHSERNKKESLDERVAKALKEVGLPNTAEMMPSELSGGMRKRIGLARAIIMKPEIMLYDEPTAGLDPVTGREISHLIMEVQKEYKTSSIIITHDLSCAEITSNRIIILKDGSVYKEGTFDEMKKSDDPNVIQFFHEVSLK